jgi:hypothetical protein
MITVHAAHTTRNNTNASYARHGRGSSLLIHPHGLSLLEFYKKLKSSGTSQRKQKHADAIANGIVQSILKTEVEVTTALRAVLSKHLSHKGDYSVTGEVEELVKGVLSDASATGRPDAVIRATRIPISGQVSQKKVVFMLIEASVDANGGEEKIGQAFDYASLIDEPNVPLLLVTFHVSRTPKKQKTSRIRMPALNLRLYSQSFKKLSSTCIIWTSPSEN